MLLQTLEVLNTVLAEEVARCFLLDVHRAFLKMIADFNIQCYPSIYQPIQKYMQETDKQTFIRNYLSVAILQTRTASALCWYHHQADGNAAISYQPQYGRTHNVKLHFKNDSNPEKIEYTVYCSCETGDESKHEGMINVNDVLSFLRTQLMHVGINDCLGILWEMCHIATFPCPRSIYLYENEDNIITTTNS